jgi:hypothetical protein
VKIAVSAPTLVAGPFGSAPPKCALSASRKIIFLAHVVGTGLAVVASRSPRPFVGFLHALGAFGVSASLAHTLRLANYAEVWGSVTTAWKKRAKKLSTHWAESARIAKVIYATHAMTVGNHAVHVVEFFAGFAKKKKRFVIFSDPTVRTECRVLAEQCKRCAHFRQVSDCERLFSLLFLSLFSSVIMTTVFLSLALVVK